ncbi:MAG: hypothetical protein AAFV59_16020 [Pseudomonadota bacterium]
MEPPQPSETGNIRVRQSSIPNLFVISYGTWFPYHLKFKSRWLFKLLMRRQAELILAKMNVKPDLVWDFDNAYQYSDLRVFRAKLNVFHPVDNLPKDIVSSKFADVVFSNAQRYLDRMSSLPKFAKVIQHGVTREFLLRASEVSKGQDHKFSKGASDAVKVGYVGNLKRPGIDWRIILKSCELFPDVKFVFVGPYEDKENTGQVRVRRCENVSFVGPKSTDEILEMSRDIDVWFMAYDRERDIDGGTNPHKLLEYLATGKVVVTNWVESYCDSDLIIMPATSSNVELPRILGRAISELQVVNAPEERARRARFTLGLGYDAHIIEIHKVLSKAIAFKMAKQS